MTGKEKSSLGAAGSSGGGLQSAGTHGGPSGQAQGVPKTKAQLQAIKEEELRNKHLTETRNFMLSVAYHDMNMFHVAQHIIWDCVNTELYRREVREQLQVHTREAVIDWTHHAAGTLLEYSNMNHRCRHEKLSFINPEPEEEVVDSFHELLAKASY